MNPPVAPQRVLELRGLGFRGLGFRVESLMDLCKGLCTDMRRGPMYMPLPVYPEPPEPLLLVVPFCACPSWNPETHLWGSAATGQVVNVSAKHCSSVLLSKNLFRVYPNLQR